MAQAEAGGDARPDVDVSSQTTPAARLQDAPPADFRRRSSASPWTPERLAVLTELWPTFTPERDIRARIEALPGPKLPDVKFAIAQHAAYRKLRRPKGFQAWSQKQRIGPAASPAAATAAPVRAAPAPVRTTSPAAAPARAEAIAAVAAASGAPIPAQLDQVRRWAAQRGISVDFARDLPAVNAKRRDLGLPAFVLTPSRGKLTAGTF